MSPVILTVLFFAAILAAYFGTRLALHADAAQAPAGRTRRSSTAKLVRCALIAAVYTALCLVLQPFSYGAVQVRIAEMLCLLPVFGADYIVGVTLGCFLANLLGVSLGTTMAVDLVFGTVATLLACLCTWKLRQVRIRGLALPAAVPPILFNALIVGAEISVFLTEGGFTWPVLVFNMLTVGLGEVISCAVLGVALVRLIEASPRLKAVFSEV
jgi:uncharacterized membrane protein